MKASKDPNWALRTAVTGKDDNVGVVAERPVNTHGQLRAAGGGVALLVSYGGVRDKYVQGWGVYRMDAKGNVVVTDKKAPWYEHGTKVFRLKLDHTVPFAQRRHAAYLEAVAWVKAQGWYDGPWARNLSGDYVPADIAKRFPLAARRRKVGA